MSMSEPHNASSAATRAVTSARSPGANVHCLNAHFHVCHAFDEPWVDATISYKEVSSFVAVTRDDRSTCISARTRKPPKQHGGRCRASEGIPFHKIGWASRTP